jgi:hypothetical protein
VQLGLQALERADRGRIDEPFRPSFSDSLALDATLRSKAPAEPRWDYVLGVHRRPVLVGIEVHGATAKEVNLVLKKLRWAKVTIEKELSGGSRQSVRWFWVASGKDGLSRNTTEWRRLVDSGMIFVGERLRSNDLR